MNTKRHIFNFIADHHVRLDYLPTQSEIRKTFASLTGDVDLHLEQLQREGLLELGGTGNDSISLPRTFPPARRIELRNASFSTTVDADDPMVRSTVALDLRGAGVALDGDLFAHVVSDGSMADAGIASGDVAILKAAQPERGEIVAVEESSRLVLRRYVVIAGIPHFLAENPSSPELTVAYDKPMHGVLWCLICIQPSGRSRSTSAVKKVSYREKNGSDLESEFMAMLRSALKENPRIRGRNVVCAHDPESLGKKSKNETTSKRPTRDNSNWPKPPSGTALNDKKDPTYQAKRQRNITTNQ